MTYPRMTVCTALLALAACVSSSPSEPYPFVGTWDCDGTVYRFTNSSYAVGNDAYDFLAVSGTGRDYTVRFADGSLMALAAVTDTGMSLFSSRTSLQRNCRRL